MKRKVLVGVIGLLAAAGLVVSACVQVTHDGPASPSDLAKLLTAGTYASTPAGATLGLTSCGGLEWKITDISLTGASGTFKATCGGGLVLTGTASGTFSGTTINWKADGDVSGAGVVCKYSLTGTAVPEGDGVRVNYTGTTCLGPISGSEFLKRT